MSFSGAVLIIVIAAIRAVTINKLPKKTFLILWGIVLFRLLIPYTVPSAFSVYTLIGPTTPVNVKTINIGTYSVTPTNVTLPPVEAITYEQTGESPQLPTNPVSPVPIGLIIWLVGMTLCAAFFTISYLHWRFEFQTSLPIQNNYVDQWLKSYLRKRPVSVRQSDKISTPLTYGIFKPVILMPKKTNWENTEQLEYVLLHEYVHICRYDSAVKLISALAVCVHWFNPLVWVMYVLFQRDIELACDESVVHRFGEASKSTYAHMLIDMEARKSGFMPLCNNFSKNAIEERITAIMKIKRTSVIAVLAAVILIAGVTTIFATTAADKNTENNDTNVSENEFDEDRMSFARMDELNMEREENKTGVIDIGALNIGDEASGDVKALKIGTINADALKVRDEASEDAEVLSLLQEMQAVAISSEENGFYHVFIPSDEGTLEGWVKKEYVDVNGWVGEEYVNID
ncbi:MAG: hypothetical protein HDR19_01170 [Lachnospiraceae bacterium]|nr:hypothetical protein [Lachnospiraceae bacterium]